jgi:hypothetical protein
MKDRDYIIEGGATGRERLRLLSEVMGPDNHALLTGKLCRPRLRRR